MPSTEDLKILAILAVTALLISVVMVVSTPFIWVSNLSRRHQPSSPSLAT